MRRCIYILLFISLLGCVSKNENPPPESIYFINQDQSAYENGRIHGSELKDVIRSQVNNWEKGISSYLKIDRDSMHNTVYRHTNFVKAIRKYTPELLEEIHGIADGAGLDRNLVLYYNLGEEIFNFCTANFESCSNIAFRGEKGNILAYNQDLPDFLHGNHRPVILRHKNHYVFTMPGNIALSGVSGKLALSCNSLPMLNMNHNGLPLPFFIRKILEFKSLEEMKDFINNTPLAIGQNLMTISETEINNVEISKNQIKWLPPQADDFYYHTNFPIENTDFKKADYKHVTCNRFEYLDSVKARVPFQPNPETDLEIICAQAPVLNNETFLRFVAKFGRGSKPEVVFINPRSNEKINLKF